MLRQKRLVALLATVVLTNAASHADDTVKNVKTAWEKRTEAIESFHYQAEMQHIRRIPLEGDEDLFGDPVDPTSPQVPIVLQSDFTFSMANGKFAIRNTGEAWDGHFKRRYASDYQACFDNENGQLLLHSQLGFTVRQAKIRDDLHGDQLKGQLMNTTVIPLWLWYSPGTYLEKRGYQLDDPNVHVETARHDGVECLEISLPWVSPASRGLLYVDPARDYVLVKYIMQRQGRTINEVSIRYAPDDRVGWVVSSWVNSYYNDRGELDFAYSGEVKKLSLNEPLDDKLFALQFPKGTRIAEHHGEENTYYAKDADGYYRPVSVDEYHLPLRLEDER